MKRHSPRGGDVGTVVDPFRQLAFAFRSPSTLEVPDLPPELVMTGTLSGFPSSPAKDSARQADAPPRETRSRRALRPAEAPRQVRLVPTVEQETDRMAAALAIYLPPGKTLELRLTNNHYSMISVRRKSDGYRLRLHRMFLGVEPRLARALARYVVHNDRRASRLLGEFIESNQHIIRQQVRRPRKFTMRTAGRHHDLQAIFDRLNVERFDGVLDARITWGPASSRRHRRRSIKMGSFAVEDRIIRIHPALDQECVPDYFVAWIVFHEMLHGKHEVKRENGRRRFHTEAFLAEERTFADYDRACAWEKQNLDRLLRV